MSYKTLPLIIAVIGTAALTGCSTTTTQNSQNGWNKAMEELVRVATASSSQTNSEVTDWTSYLASMQRGCDIPDMSKNIPTRLIRSVKNSNIYAPPDDGEIRRRHNYYLQNAVAFGYPIKEIEYMDAYEEDHVIITFADNRFTNLRPSFKLPSRYKFPEVERNDSAGYTVIDKRGVVFTSLTFDTRDNSIECSSGV